MEPTLQAPLQHCPHRLLQPSCPTADISPMGCSSSLGLLLWVLSTGCASFKLHSLLHCRFFHGCMWRSAPSGAYGLQGTACTIIGLYWAAGSYYSLPGAHPALLQWRWALQFHFPLFTLLSPSCTTFFFTFLNVLSMKQSQHWLWLISAQWRVPLGAVGSGSDLTWHKLEDCAHRGYPCCPQTTKILPHIPNTLHYPVFSFIYLTHHWTFYSIPIMLVGPSSLSSQYVSVSVSSFSV